MGTTQPIRKKEDIVRLKRYFLDKKEYRNYALIVVGLNLPIRISDLLNLKWDNVYDVKCQMFYEHIFIREQKTKKMNCLALNRTCQEALLMLKQHVNPTDKGRYIFTSKRCAEHPLSRVSAYLIIHNAANELGMKNISCHSLRKTFGYHAWKEGVHLALIMEIYNHSSINVTRKYLCIEQDDKDQVLYSTEL